MKYRKYTKDSRRAKWGEVHDSTAVIPRKAIVSVGAPGSGEVEYGLELAIKLLNGEKMDLILNRAETKYFFMNLVRFYFGLDKVVRREDFGLLGSMQHDSDDLPTPAIYAMTAALVAFYKPRLVEEDEKI